MKKLWEEMKAVTETKMIQDEKVCEVPKRDLFETHAPNAKKS